MSYQWGKINLHISFFAIAVWHFSGSTFSATRCVTSFEIEGEYKPPIASTPPIIASLSPSGRSAQLTTRPENIKRGSGLYDRVFASFRFANEPAIHSGFTTGISASDAVSNSSNSIVVEMIWVRPFK